MAMKRTFEKLMSSLDEVESYLAGENHGFRVDLPESIDNEEISVTSTWHSRSSPPHALSASMPLSIGNRRRRKGSSSRRVSAPSGRD
jgi:hypothetical protein